MGGGIVLSIFSTVHEIYRTFEILTPKSPPPGTPWGGMGKKTNFIDFLDSSWHFPVFWFFDPLKFPLRPLLVGGGGEIFFIDFLDSSWNLPDFLNVDLQPPLPGTPRGGMCKKIFFIDFLDSSWHFPEFWLLICWPPKIPTSTPPPLGGEVYFFRQEPSPDLQGFMQVGKYDSIAFWHVGASTVWVGLGRNGNDNVRHWHCGKVSKCELFSFWAIHLYHGGWV